MKAIGAYAYSQMADTGYTKEKTSQSSRNMSQQDWLVAQPNKRPVIAAIVTGMFLFGIGLPLLIVGSTSTGEDRLAMIIPGAILFSVGSFSILVSAIGACLWEGNLCQLKILSRQNRFKIPASRY